MNRPLLALQGISQALPGGQVHACKPEHRRAWRLQVVPDVSAVLAEKLVAEDFPVQTCRVCSFLNPVPSARMVQIRSTRAQGPSWQKSSWFGSVGENCV